MAAITNYSSAYTTNPSAQLTPMPGGHYDANLVLHTAAVTATANSTAIDVEGGKFAEVMVQFTAVSGTSPTLDTVIQASPDGGTTYYGIGNFPQFNTADDDTSTARPVWVPSPTGTNRTTKVRLAFTAGGTTPSFTGTWRMRDLGEGGNSALNNLT